MQTRAAKTPIAVCCRASRVLIAASVAMRPRAAARSPMSGASRCAVILNYLEAHPQSKLQEAALVMVPASSRRPEAALEFRDLQRNRRWSVVVQIRRVDVVVMVVEN